MRARLGSLATALAILAILGVAYTAYRPDSGIVVRALQTDGEPRDVRIRVGKAGRRELVAAADTGREGRVRLRLEPGRYLLRAGGRPTRRTIAVVVRDGFRPVTVRYR